MPDQFKVTFQLTSHADRLEVRAEARGGQAPGETALPPADLLERIFAADPRRIPASLVEEMGSALYAALVNKDIDELVFDTLNDAMRAGQPAHFELRFDADQAPLTRFPWEMVRNRQGQFLIRDGLVDLTRYITYPQPPPTFDPAIRDLPLFRVIASPPRLEPITAGDLKIKPIQTLGDATFEAFLRALLIDRLSLWGIHFDGHGALVRQCANCDALNDPDDAQCWQCGLTLVNAREVGALAFEKGGEVNWVRTDEFGSVLFNAHVRLALLLACESAKVGGRAVWSGLAPGLLLAGVPAVIGMQYPVLDTFANSFANEFYAALVRDGDILLAMRTARRMNIQGAWYNPALYLRRQPAEAEQALSTAYLTRKIDTAAPARVQPGVDFLVRLWIRRPETKPLTEEKLREELDIPASVPVRQSHGQAEVKFEPVEEKRKLRRGEIEIGLQATGCEVKPQDRIKLFIDEHVDAPPAIFAVRVTAAGRANLVFTVWQDGGQIHSVIHHVDVVNAEQAAQATEVATHSQTVQVAGGDIVDGNKISVGDIQGSTGVAIGRAAQAVVAEEKPTKELPLVTRIPAPEPPADAPAPPPPPPTQAEAPAAPPGGLLGHIGPDAAGEGEEQEVLDIKSLVRLRLEQTLEPEVLDGAASSEESLKRVEDAFNEILGEEGLILPGDVRRQLFERIIAERPSAVPASPKPDSTSREELGLDGSVAADPDPQASPAPLPPDAVALSAFKALILQRLEEKLGPDVLAGAASSEEGRKHIEETVDAILTEAGLMLAGSDRRQILEEIIAEQRGPVHTGPDKAAMLEEALSLDDRVSTDDVDTRELPAQESPAEPAAAPKEALSLDDHASTDDIDTRELPAQSSSAEPAPVFAAPSETSATVVGEKTRLGGAVAPAQAAGRKSSALSPLLIIGILMLTVGLVIVLLLVILPMLLNPPA